MASAKPDKLVIHTFNVGFGDCFLLTFSYPRMKRHVLIDFGRTHAPDNNNKSLKQVAQQIEKLCGGKLHAVVATHRHRDHISGFSINKNGTGTGTIIKNLRPDVIIQPWTEHPKAQPDAKKAPTLRGLRIRKQDLLHISTLANMQAVAAAAVQFTKQYRFGSGQAAKAEMLKFLGENNLSNKNAVNGLLKMGTRHYYVSFGTSSGLSSILPGITTHVLGPPTLHDTETILKQRRKDTDEFWHLQALASGFSQGKKIPLFPSPFEETDNPVSARWFRSRMQRQRLELTLGIARILDKAMNNTSVILLFECNDKYVLFPGDAQIENWSFAMQHDKVKNLLRKVDVYKVGHHGSLNATPKESLWKGFKKRGLQGKGRLKALLSTRSGIHGHETDNTEVPRQTLLNALKNDTSLINTQDFSTNQLTKPIEILLS